MQFHSTTKNIANLGYREDKATRFLKLWLRIIAIIKLKLGFAWVLGRKSGLGCKLEFLIHFPIKYFYLTAKKAYVRLEERDYSIGVTAFKGREK